MYVIDSEIKKAVEELHTAENHFNWAEPEYIDAAAYKVSAAKAKLNALIKNKKLEVAA